MFKGQREGIDYRLERVELEYTKLHEAEFKRDPQK
jgi:hypothetical protein